MPALTSPQIRNYVRRAFRELVDPSPDKAKVAEIWRHFNGQCAYCARPLKKELKEGHIDHLVSAAKSGANHPANRVLACATCNEKEKLDRDWLAFLREKCPDDETFGARHARILAWQHTQGDAAAQVDLSLLRAADLAAEEVNALFSGKYVELRDLARASGLAAARHNGA